MLSHICPCGFMPGICDKEIHHYSLNFKETVATRRLSRLPATPKNGRKFRHAFYHISPSLHYFDENYICFPLPIKTSTYCWFLFSGSEVSLTTQENIGDFVIWITHLCQKVWLSSIAFSSFFLVGSLQISQGWQIAWLNESWAQPTNILQLNLGVQFGHLPVKLDASNPKTLQPSWTSCTKNPNTAWLSRTHQPLCPCQKIATGKSIWMGEVGWLFSDWAWAVLDLADLATATMNLVHWMIRHTENNY